MGRPSNGSKFILLHFSLVSVIVCLLITLIDGTLVPWLVLPVAVFALVIVVKAVNSAYRGGR